MKNYEIIPIADSTILRFIDELNGLKNMDQKVLAIREEIKQLQKSEKINKRQELNKLYTKLNTLQFKPDYLCLVIDKISDYRRAFEKGFKVNGIKYSRLLATTGGVKGQVIIFTSETLKPLLRKRLENGRNPEIELVPAKFGAYESLTCSSSTIVSDPKGTLVVKDCEVEFYENVIKLDDSYSDEPLMTFEENYLIKKNASDGYGLINPERSAIWGKELGLDYIPSGFCTRGYAFNKGMLVTFDFLDFANKIANSYFVTDAWGDEVDIRTVDVILTTSMLKLWNSYTSFDDYMKNCKENNYKFCITKVCPFELENERNLNYQFIQSYQLTDSQLDELIKPTIDELKEVLGNDYRKSILFLRGCNITEETAEFSDYDYIKALQIDKRMINDPYVRNCIHKMINKKIDQAKVGVIKVNGNFQIACGDPYALCQSMFGLEVTGLLKKGEFYSQYWSDKCIDTVVCFRAPMTCHNNIRKLSLPNREDMKYWYQYIKTMLIFNSWDTTAEAENGEDFDGDQNLLTDNKILIENHRELPTVICVQRNATKAKIAEDLLVQANIDSFGDDIGIYTNGITGQFEVQAKFNQSDNEFKELEYRILCGQLFQQNSIDKTKGIMSKPRPKHWFDYSSNKINNSDDVETKLKKEINASIVSDKKPYFMIYIYPQLMKTYNKYIKEAEKKCQTNFKLSIKELEEKENQSVQESDFLKYYLSRMPVGTNACIINKICLKIEKEFDGYIRAYSSANNFDYSILKSSYINEESNLYKNKKKIILKLYNDYMDSIQKYKQRTIRERIDEDTTNQEKTIMLLKFRQDCYSNCPDEYMLANIVLDLCYSANKSKQFAWDISGNVFIKNLLSTNNNIILYPIEHPDGDILYSGKRFIMNKKYIGG